MRTKFTAPPSTALDTYPMDQAWIVDSEFATLNDPPIGGFIPNLANGIHPLFQRVMFQNLDDQEYAELDTPLRLASRMLSCDRAVDYISTMTNGRLHKLTEENKLGQRVLPVSLVGDTLPGARLVRLPVSTAGLPPGNRFDVTDQKRARSRRLLLNLVQVLDEIVVFPMGAVATDSTRLSQRQASSGTFNDFPAAMEYMLTIDLEYDTVWDFKNYPQNSSLALACHWYLALTLVHEIAHVINIAVHGSRSLEDIDIFFGRQWCNEAGLNIEKHIFGGIPNMSKLDEFITIPTTTFEECMMLRRYPSRKINQRYKADLIPIQERQPIDQYEIFSRIPWSFIRSLFRESFWSRDVPAMPWGPIQPPGLRSWVYQPVQVGDQYIGEYGDWYRAKECNIVPCNANDPGLPTRVKAEFVKIFAQQRARGQ